MGKPIFPGTSFLLPSFHFIFGSFSFLYLYFLPLLPSYNLIGSDNQDQFVKIVMILGAPSMSDLLAMKKNSKQDLK